MTAQSRAEVEDHLRHCTECAALLADLRSISRAVREAPLATIPNDVLLRLRRGLHAATDRGIVRIASWLTAAAAVILVGALLVSSGHRGDVTKMASVSGTWQIDAVSPPATELADGSMSTDIVPAQWMTDEFRLPEGSR